MRQPSFFDADPATAAGVRYATILADPPWRYADRMLRMRSTGNGAAAQYRVLDLDAIARFLETERIASADDAHLWLWTTNAFVEAAHAVARAWGFAPKTLVTWVKGRIADGRLVSHIGQGHYLRNSTEHVVFAVRGTLPPAVRTLPTAFVYPGRWEGRRHSEKPPVIHEWAERMGRGPRVELFARRAREGWDVIGDEVGGTR